MCGPAQERSSTRSDEGITKHLGDVATELGLSAPEQPPPLRAPEVSPPPLKSRRLETQLMMILGAGFGFGVALAVTRGCSRASRRG